VFQLSSVSWCTWGSHLRKFSRESYLRKWLSQETFWCVIGFTYKTANSPDYHIFTARQLIWSTSHSEGVHSMKAFKFLRSKLCKLCCIMYDKCWNTEWPGLYNRPNAGNQDTQKIGKPTTQIRLFQQLLYESATGEDTSTWWPSTWHTSSKCCARLTDLKTVWWQL